MYKCEDLSSCIERAKIDGFDPFYYDTRLGKEIPINQLHPLYMKCICSIVKPVHSVESIKQNGKSFEIYLVSSEGQPIRKTVINFFSSDKTFVCRDYDPRVIIPMIISHYEFAEFFIKELHPFYAERYVPKYNLHPNRQYESKLQHLPFNQRITKAAKLQAGPLATMYEEAEYELHSPSSPRVSKLKHDTDHLTRGDVNEILDDMGFDDSSQGESGEYVFSDDDKISVGSCPVFNEEPILDKDPSDRLKLEDPNDTSGRDITDDSDFMFDSIMKSIKSRVQEPITDSDQHHDSESKTSESSREDAPIYDLSEIKTDEYKKPFVNITSYREILFLNQINADCESEFTTKKESITQTTTQITTTTPKQISSYLEPQPIVPALSLEELEKYKDLGIEMRMKEILEDRLKQQKIKELLAERDALLEEKKKMIDAESTRADITHDTDSTEADFRMRRQREHFARLRYMQFYKSQYESDIDFRIRQQKEHIARLHTSYPYIPMYLQRNIHPDIKIVDVELPDLAIIPKIPDRCDNIYHKKENNPSEQVGNTSEQLVSTSDSI